MPWMWWGISCRRSAFTGQAETTLDEASRQLIFHAADLTRGPALNVGGRVIDLSPDLLDLLEAIGVGALSIATGGVGGAVLGGAKAGYDNRDLLGRLHETHARRTARARECAIDATSPATTADEQMVEGLVKLCRPRPLVVVMEDAHIADPRVVRLLDQLLPRTSARVLVVATCVPGALEATVDDPEVAPTTFGPWAHRRIAARPTDDRRVDLAKLDPTDARELIATQLPAAAPVADELIARHGTNPLLLRALLQLPRLIRAAATRPLRSRDLAGLPTTLDAVYAELWEDLPTAVRDVLGRAAQLNGERYVTKALERTAPDDPQPITDGLNRAITPHSWSRPIDEMVHGFIEPTLQKVARRKGEDDTPPRSDRAPAPRHRRSGGPDR